jgi:hypothetical protein
MKFALLGNVQFECKKATQAWSPDSDVRIACAQRRLVDALYVRSGLVDVLYHPEWCECRAGVHLCVRKAGCGASCLAVVMPLTSEP